jgi:hypothetical protein
MTKEERYEQFTKDMESAGHEVEHYDGRNFYHGPSVTIDSDDLQDVIRSTKINLQWDSMGKSGMTVYPC